MALRFLLFFVWLPLFWIAACPPPTPSLEPTSEIKAEVSSEKTSEAATEIPKDAAPETPTDAPPESLEALSETILEAKPEATVESKAESLLEAKPEAAQEKAPESPHENPVEAQPEVVGRPCTIATEDIDCGRRTCSQTAPDMCKRSTPVCQQGRCAVLVVDIPQTECHPQSGACQAPKDKCSNHCDCLQELLCAPGPQGEGVCVRGIVPTYCCEKSGCPRGKPCYRADGTQTTCR